jgi:hypothetical protein
MRFVRIILCCTCVLMINSSLLAQTDPGTSIEYEPEKTADVETSTGFGFLKRSMIEERSMFKLSVLPNYTGYYGVGLNNSLEYERKVTPSFSFTAGLSNDFNLQRGIYSETPARVFLRQSALNFSVRYYYSQKKDIRSGLSGNNLSSNYFELKVEDAVSFRRYPGGKINEMSFSPNLVLAYGLQRRFGRYGYLDLAAGVRFPLEDMRSERPWLYTKVGLGVALPGLKVRK